MSVGAQAAEVPDLSGIYDVSTLTPLRRPQKFGERLILSDEEAEAIARAEALLIAKREASDANRTAPPAGGNVGSYNRFWFDRGKGAFKIDGKWRTSIITDPVNGRHPPLTGEAKARATARAKLSRPNSANAWWVTEGIDPGPFDDPEMRSLTERCLMGFGSVAGPPMLPVGYNNLKRIVQTKAYVLIYVEMIHDARIIRMDSEHAPSDIRNWLGDSVGHWEGETLVIDTTNFNDTPALANASRNLHVIERLTRIDDDTLLYQFTVDDPTVWTKPWSGEYPWPSTESRIYEYACHEANYSFGGILRGARLLEREAHEQAGQNEPK